MSIGRAIDLCTIIDRNYPLWPSTFSKCCTDDCGNLSRGGGLCSVCAASELAALVGRDLAYDYLSSVSDKADAALKIMSKLKQENGK